MSDEIADAGSSRKYKHRIPTWLWSAIVTELIRDSMPVLFGSVTTLFGVVTAFLLLLKAGVIQLSHWPMAAIIALFVFDIILVLLVFVLAIVYAAHAVLGAMESVFRRWSKTQAPTRARWLAPIDTLALWVIGRYFGLLYRLRRMKHGNRPEAAAE